jgi:hypothetical protein
MPRLLIIATSPGVVGWARLATTCRHETIMARLEHEGHRGGPCRPLRFESDGLAAGGLARGGIARDGTAIRSAPTG